MIKARVECGSHVSVVTCQAITPCANLLVLSAARVLVRSFYPLTDLSQLAPRIRIIVLTPDDIASMYRTGYTDASPGNLQTGVTQQSQFNIAFKPYTLSFTQWVNTTVFILFQKCWFILRLEKIKDQIKVVARNIYRNF